MTEMVGSAFDVAIIIVGFRNSADVCRCVSALVAMTDAPVFRIFVAENGGPAAFDELASALGSLALADDGGSAQELPGLVRPGNRCLEFELSSGVQGGRVTVHIAEMVDNLGYGGGVNAWLEPLLLIQGWSHVWVLNPDTKPAPDSLSELVAYSTRQTTKGMIGSRMTLLSRPDRIQTRGLSWSKLRAGVVAVDGHTPAGPPRDPDALERRLDAPTGAAMFVDRKLIERIGLMPEQYFLYAEDLEWGLRAKRVGAVGYADKSVVLHQGGSTIGTARRRRDRSALSVYLYARNRILFVRENYPNWMAWTVLVSLAHLLVFLAVGAPSNFFVSFRGFRAGLAGETGRPVL